MTPQRARRAQRRDGAQWMLATQPGLGKLVADRLADRERSRGRVESDGRSDLVIVESPNAPDAEKLGAEDLFVMLAEGPSKSTASATANGLFDATRWQIGLDSARDLGVRIGGATTFRVIVRVRSEKRFKRTELRAAVIARVAHWRPRWRVADPAALELWVLETKPEHFRLAARVSRPSMRQRGGRVIERPGSLRPSVAAAMVAAAGTARGTLLDPFCGSGTVLREAVAAGWQAIGGDLDSAAVRAAKQNVPSATFTRWDAADLPLADRSAQAVVTNPPFGKQHQPQTGGLSEANWWDAILRELVRVVEPAAPIVVLHPGDGAYGGAVKRSGMSARRITTVTTLGQRATIWHLRPRDGSRARAGRP